VTAEVMGSDHRRLAGELRDSIYAAVHAERLRAHAKHGARGNSREDANWWDAEWLPILVEEVGEVAHCLTYDAELYNLRDELVQVGAMACAWIAAIDDDATGRGVLGSDNTHFSNPSNRPC